MNNNEDAVFFFLEKKELFLFESNKSKIVADLPKFRGQIFYYKRKETLAPVQGKMCNLFFVKSILWNFKKFFSSSVKKVDAFRDKSKGCEIKVESKLHVRLKQFLRLCSHSPHGRQHFEKLKES